MAYINHERANELTRRIIDLPGIDSVKFLEDKRLWLVYVSDPQAQPVKDAVLKIAKEYGAPIEFDSYNVDWQDPDFGD